MWNKVWYLRRAFGATDSNNSEFRVSIQRPTVLSTGVQIMRKFEERVLLKRSIGGPGIIQRRVFATINN